MLSEDALIDELEDLRAAGKTVGFTNGCFDLLHVGHVRYLREARDQVDTLIVGVNGDESVRELKGPERPLVPEEERAEVVAALSAVDYVVLFRERTAERLVGLLRPDVYFKGADYSLDPGRLPEATVVVAYGGEVRLMPLNPGRSSSALIERIRSAGWRGGGGLAL